MYSKETIYVIGTSKLSKSDPITSSYDMFFISLMIDTKTDCIVDSTCNMVKTKTEAFINDVIVGYNILTQVEDLEGEIFKRYHGIAQKALAAAIKDAANKYKVIKEVHGY